MKYRFPFMSQTQIGKLFYKNNKSMVCATSHDVGRWLIAVGLRDGNMAPSQKALDNGFVFQQNCGPNEDVLNSYWNSEKTVEKLEKGGYKRIPNPPSNLVLPDKMVGPYVFVQNHINMFEVKAHNGDTVATVYDQRNAKTVTDLLNIYDRSQKRKAIGETP